MIYVIAWTNKWTTMRSDCVYLAYDYKAVDVAIIVDNIYLIHRVLLFKEIWIVRLFAMLCIHVQHAMHVEWTVSHFCETHLFSSWIYWLKKKPLKSMIKLTWILFSTQHHITPIVWQAVALDFLRASVCVSNISIYTCTCTRYTFCATHEWTGDSHFNFVLRVYFILFIYEFLFDEHFLSLSFSLTPALSQTQDEHAMKHLSPTKHGPQENLFEQSVIVCRVFCWCVFLSFFFVFFLLVASFDFSTKMHWIHCAPRGVLD